MYQLSRSLYRELASMLPVSVDSLDGSGRRDRRVLLETCETAVQRRVLEPEMCRNLSRTLFRDVRNLFPLDAQAKVWATVKFHVEAGRPLADRMRQDLKRECQAITRNGTPCRREPPPGRRYCPSHYSLAEDLQLETAPASA